MKTTLTGKSKLGNRKQSINSTVKLFHQRFKNAQMLESEVRRQISDNLDSEIVSQTFQEFIRNVEQTEKIVEVMAQSESSQVLGPLEEAEKLTTMKIEIMQIIKQHEISMRKETSRASSRSSLRSRMSAVSSTLRKNQQKPLKASILTTKTKYSFLRKTLLNPQEKRKSKPKKQTTTTTIGKYNLRNRSIPKLGACTGREADFDPKQLSQVRTSFHKKMNLITTM